MCTHTPDEHSNWMSVSVHQEVGLTTTEKYPTSFKTHKVHKIAKIITITFIIKLSFLKHIQDVDLNKYTHLLNDILK